MRLRKIDPPSLSLSLGASFVTFALPAVLACGGTSGSPTTQSQSALTSAALSADVPACLTTYVDCDRATGSDLKACRAALHDCLRPRPDGGGAGGHCDHGGPGGPGDGDRPPPDGRGPDGHGPDGDADDDGGAGPAGGPRACFDALDQCAQGTDTTGTCVDAAVTCLAALPPPPNGGHGGPPRR